MVEELEFKGQWWLPGRPEKLIPGQLRVSPYDKATLDLQGTLGGQSDFFYPLVLGNASLGKPITLQNLYVTHRSFSSDDFSASQLIVHTVFEGVHFDTSDQIIFRSVSVRYANFDQWVRHRSFRIESDNGGGTTKILYERPGSIDAECGDYGIQITAGLSLDDRRNEIAAAEKAMLSIYRDRGESFDEFVRMSHYFQNFLSLVMGAPTHPTEISGQTGVKEQASENEEETLLPVRVYYPVVGWGTAPHDLPFFEMLFTLRDIQDNFKEYVCNWISKASVLQPVYDLYFSSLYNTHQYTQHTFLSLAQAIETYSRRRYGGKYQEDDEYLGGLYQSFIAAIPQGTDKGFRQSLVEGRLRYANEHSLRKRLQSIFSHVSANLPVGILGSRQVLGDFVGKVCDTRNYLTHYDSALEAKAAKGEELHTLTQRLWAVLGICLLEELGFSFESIKHMISKNRRYRYILQIR